MGDKGEGGVKNLKKWVTSFMDSLEYPRVYRRPKLHGDFQIILVLRAFINLQAIVLLLCTVPPSL